MKTRLQDFSSFSTDLLAEVEMNEHHLNKVNFVCVECLCSLDQILWHAVHMYPCIDKDVV